MAYFGPLDSNFGIGYSETTSDRTIGAGASALGHLNHSFTTSERGPITVSVTFAPIYENGSINCRCKLRLGASTTSPYFPVAVQFSANHAQQTSGSITYTFADQPAGSYTAYVDVYNRDGEVRLNYWSPGDSAWQNDILTVRYLTT